MAFRFSSPEVTLSPLLPIEITISNDYRLKQASKLGRLTALAVVAAACALSGCGGGGGSSDNSGGGGSTASIQACFTAINTVNYTYAHTGNASVLKGSFGPGNYNSQPVTKQTYFYSDGTSATQYLALTNSDVAQIAELHWDGRTITYSPNFIFLPLSIQPGQSFNQHFTQYDDKGNSYPVDDHRTFVGFETLTLAGKTFNNVCHFTSHWLDDNSGTTADTDFWFAPGYGGIKESGTNFDGSTYSFQYNGGL